MRILGETLILYSNFNLFRKFEPAKRFQIRSDLLEFWSLDNSSSKRFLEGRGKRKGKREVERGDEEVRRDRPFL